MELVSMFKSKCKVCKSPHRTDYEKMRNEGYSYRDITFRAREEFNEQISHVAIRNHFEKHVSREESNQNLNTPAEGSKVTTRKVLIPEESLRHLAHWALFYFDEMLFYRLEDIRDGKKVDVQDIEPLLDEMNKIEQIYPIQPTFPMEFTDETFQTLKNAFGPEVAERLIRKFKEVYCIRTKTMD